MKIFDTKDIREIDSYTILKEPVSSIDLMERAAIGCVNWIINFIEKNSDIFIFAGPGNNGGDGLAIARILLNKGCPNVNVFHLKTGKISEDCSVNLDRLLNQGKIIVSDISSENDFPQPGSETIIIDALYGSGLTRPLEGISANLVDFINSSGCKVISIDIPSGLFGEDNSDNAIKIIIRADKTLTFEFPKRSFFFSENEEFIGKWHIINIGLHKSIIEKKQTDFFYLTPEQIRKKIKKRKNFSHKGDFGHALLVAGSYGMMGAAVLAARACLRTGAGLLTAHIPKTGYPIMQISVPEAIITIDNSETHFSSYSSLDKYSAIGIGPGIGTKDETRLAFLSLLENNNKPMIIDADALNIMSAEGHDILSILPENTIITPHPGEFDRLAGKSENGYIRNQLQIQLSKKYKIIIILKGAYSSITLPDGKCFYNSTGNPGMATGGSGDVLTGIILSLLTQGYSQDDAAILGTYVHGLAGDIAVEEISQQSLIASDIVNNIGKAFKTILNYEKSEK